MLSSISDSAPHRHASIRSSQNSTSGGGSLRIHFTWNVLSVKQVFLCACSSMPVTNFNQTHVILLRRTDWTQVSVTCGIHNKRQQLLFLFVVVPKITESCIDFFFWHITAVLLLLLKQVISLHLKGQFTKNFSQNSKNSCTHFLLTPVAMEALVTASPFWNLIGGIEFHPIILAYSGKKNKQNNNNN